jgi:tetratricopeptide (TPR) repeat protein
VPRKSASILNLALLCGAVLADGAAVAQQKLPPPPPAKEQAPKNEQGPPEEDESIEKPKEYSFNPLQAEKELRIGNFYFKKGSYKAAANRFREATHWNPGLAEPYFRLGEAEDKLRDKKAAREAYAKFVELAPEDKRAEGAKKKLGGKP